MALVAIWEERRRERAEAERLKMLADEEESKTPYPEDDLMQEFEYKIIRTELNLFDRPELLAEALREEAQAGWELVEKFDGNRVRLKRPTSQRAKDGALPPDFDPYQIAALPEATKKAKAAKRSRDLKIWGGVLAGSAGVAVVLSLVGGLASKALMDDIDRLGLDVPMGIAWVIAIVVAASCAIGLIVRYFSK